MNWEPWAIAILTVIVPMAIGWVVGKVLKIECSIVELQARVVAIESNCTRHETAKDDMQKDIKIMARNIAKLCQLNGIDEVD